MSRAAVTRRPGVRGAALVVALAALASAPAAAAAPSLRLLDDRPLLVAGAGFVPGERVALTAMTLSGPRVVRVRAGVAGRFRARLPVAAGGCSAAVAIRALGTSGRRAAVWLTPATPCVPPPRD